jgi:cell division protein FtsZ
MAGMGHAVMGTAVRSGENRAIEAAQAAMASPLLDAGAIDGARGILINITGSSSLKLSEVNQASTLIQSSAHEDANIIFGAVQDERMGDEVKITVIATGFRDQMPERRARMLSVEEAPVVSVPVMASENWMREAAQVAAAPVGPGPARFLSEQEDQGSEDGDEPAFFSAASSPARKRRAVEEPEPVGVSARPQFAELAEDPAFMPLSRDFSSDFGDALREAAAENPASGSVAPVAESANEAERDLDVPAFMRRLKF